MRPVAPGEAQPGSLWRRLAWFFGIAACAGATTAMVAYGLKALLA